MHLYVSWALYDIAKQAGDRSPEYVSLAASGLADSEDPQVQFSRELLSVQIMAPWTQTLLRYQAAVRLARRDEVLPVALATRASLARQLGEDFGVGARPGLRIVGLRGTRAFLATLAGHCAVHGRPLPFDFWCNNPNVLELPFSDDEIRKLLLGCSLQDTSGAYSQLLADWAGVGASALNDMRTLVTLAHRLGMRDAIGVDSDESDE
jgi:hypothetical protein